MLEHDLQQLLGQTDEVAESRDVRMQADLVRLEFQTAIKEARQLLQTLRRKRDEAALKAD